MRLPIWLLPLTILATRASSQSIDCSCGASLDTLVAKLEANYAGYVLEVRGHRDAEYARHKRALGARARRTSPQRCHLVLSDYLRWFADGHLFVGQYPRLGAEDSLRLARDAEVIDRTEVQVRAYLARDVSKLDPIEGIWHAPEGYMLGIVRAPVRGRREFAAIMLSDSVKNWRRGQVKAEFRRLRDGSYDVTLYGDDHAPRFTHVFARGEIGGASIRQGVMLHMPPITWGKEFPIAAEHLGRIDPREPRAPTIRAAGMSTVVVSVPSHVPTYAGRLDSLVKQWRSRILAADNLIIDVRSDEGGSSWMTGPLMPFVVTPAKRPPRYYAEGETVILASPDNARYFDQMMSQGWVPKQLPSRLRSRMGELVPFADPDTSRAGDSTSSKRPASAEPADTATARPRRVAIIIDRSSVSAAEAFAMSAMRNEKVTLFGDNSGGVLDYGTTTVLRFGCRRLGLAFGYPIMTQSDKLPAGGIRTTGIAPDVRIPASEKDPVGFVVRYLEQR